MSASSSPRLRLVFLCESGTDVRLVDGLAARFNLTILGRNAFGERLISWPSEKGGFELIRGPADRAAFGLFALRWMMSRRSEYDVVLAQNQGVATLAALEARRVTGRPVIALLCSPNALYYRCRWRKREISLPKYMAGRFALEATRQACVLERPAYAVLSHHLASIADGSGKARVEVIPVYGVDPNVFYPVSSDERREARSRLGLPEQARILFFSSRIAAEKDTETLLDAIRILVDRGESLIAVNASGGYQQFLNQAERRGLGRHCRAYPAAHPLQGLRDFYWSADVCAQASLEEGLGFSPLESLAAGTPVVASAVGGLLETIRQHETGLSVRPRDPSAFAEALSWAFAHPVEMQAMTRRGAAMVRDQFDARQVFGQLESLARDLVDAN